MSRYWTYYQKMPELRARCNICMKIIKTGGSTTNLRNHLKCKHKEYLDLLDDSVTDVEKTDKSKLHDILIVEDDDMQIEDVSVEDSGMAAQNSRSASPAQSENSNMSEESIENEDDGRNLEKSGSRYEEITNALLYMVCMDIHPHVLVEMPGFVRLSRTLQPLYCLPSSDEVLDMIATKYKIIKSKIVHKLKEIEHVSLSCSILSVKDKNFVVVTAHFICSIKEKPVKIFLGTRLLEPIYTQDEVGEAIQIILDDFELPVSKCLSVCNDESIFLKAAIEKLFGEGKSVSCFGNAFHSILNDVIDDISNPILKSIINELEIAIEYINQNVRFFDDRTSFTEEETEDVLKLLEYMDDVTPTTRNSVHHIMHNFLRLLPFIEKALENGRFEDIPPAVSNPNVEVLTEITRVLASFEEATQELSAYEYLTGSLVVPLISCVQSFLKDVSLVYDVSKTLREKLLMSLEGWALTSSNPLLGRATFFDPRFKKMYVSPTILDNVIEECCTEVKQNSEGRSLSEDPANVTTLWKAHEKNIASHNKTDTNVPYEFQVYLEQSPLPRTVDPFRFWMQNRGCMPSLSQVALKNLTVCGSSVPVDNFVKVLQKIFSDARFCWTEEHIIERLFLSQLDDEYWKSANESSAEN